MVCIYCQGKLSVFNSRAQKLRNQTWRRRKCQKCQAIFTSVESLDLSKALVIQKGKELQAFSRDQLFTSIYESCRHRAAAAQDAANLTDTIISTLLSRTTQGLLTTATIVEIATAVLGRFDNAAAVQYAAFHPVPVDRK